MTRPPVRTSSRVNQTVAISFWPTAATFAQDRLVVAGVQENLDTCIELWDLDCPPVPETGNVYAASIRRQVLFQANQPGRRQVRFLRTIQSPNGEKEVLVHFADSNDICQLDLRSASLRVVIPGSAAPDLAHRMWQGIWVGDHATEGYLYVYWCDPNGPRPDVGLVLRDANRDGTIDSCLALPRGEMNQALGSPPPWLRFFEN